MTRTSTSSSTSTFGRRAVALATLAAAATAVVILPAGSASAEAPVVIGPLLQVFTFGADVGIPTGCLAGSAALGSGAAEFGFAQQTAPVIEAINNGCDTVQAQGDKYIAIGNDRSAPAVALNPYVNPMIGQAADTTNQLAADYGPALAPFGGTLAGVGATLNFFQGK